MLDLVFRYSVLMVSYKQSKIIKSMVRFSAMQCLLSFFLLLLIFSKQKRQNIKNETYMSHPGG